MANRTPSVTPGPPEGACSPARPSRVSRPRLAVLIAVVCAAVLVLLDRLTQHPGETVILLMPPALGAFLWFGWPSVRRVAWWKYGLYVVLLTPILAGAMYLVARIARGRLLWVEVFWGLYFTIALRLAWTVWKLTVGRLGERWRRWGRMRGYRGQGTGDSKQKHTLRLLAMGTRFIAPARIALTVFIFVPLALGSLVHRIKIGNPTDLAGYANLPVEPIRFRTDDGVGLSGWFLPEANSDSTVIICHGAGANKSNFLEFLLVFRYQGYNSLIFDFRGHGASEGHTCTFGLYEQADVNAAVDWLKKYRPERAKHVYGLGSSMGAMSLVRAAAQDPRIEAVILDSCFASAPLLAEQHVGRMPPIRQITQLVLASMSLHAGRSLWDLDAREAIAALSPRPVLLIHGTDDVLIPPVNMEILYECAKEPKDKWLGPGPHSNIMTTDFVAYQRRVIEFLDKAPRKRAE